MPNAANSETHLVPYQTCVSEAQEGQVSHRAIPSNGNLLDAWLDTAAAQA